MGRCLGHLDQALDHLSCVGAGPSFDPERVLGQLQPHLPRLSGIVFVAPGWSPEHHKLAEGIRHAGVGCRSLRVAPLSSKKSDAVPNEGSEIQTLRVEDIVAACGTGPELTL